MTILAHHALPPQVRSISSESPWEGKVPQESPKNQRPGHRPAPKSHVLLTKCVNKQWLSVMRKLTRSREQWPRTVFAYARYVN